MLIERGYDALLQRGPGDVEAEVLPSVRGVQEHSALLRVHDLRHDPAVVVEDAARVSRKQVRDDVALFQQREQVARDRRAVGDAAVADVDHQPHSSLAGGLLGESHHLDAEDRYCGSNRANLHALYQRLVRLDDADGLFEVYVVAARDLGLEVESGPGDVQHTHDARLDLGDDVLREAAERVAASAAGVDHRRHARVHACEVGVHAGLVHTVIDVRVEVDHAGHDELAVDLHHPRVGAGPDVRRDLGYCAILDSHVQLRIEAL